MLGGKREDRDGADKRRRCDDVFATRDFAAFARFLTLFRRRLFRSLLFRHSVSVYRWSFFDSVDVGLCADRRAIIIFFYSAVERNLPIMRRRVFLKFFKNPPCRNSKIVYNPLVVWRRFTKLPTIDEGL